MMQGPFWNMPPHSTTHHWFQGSTCSYSTNPVAPLKDGCPSPAVFSDLYSWWNGSLAFLPRERHKECKWVCFQNAMPGRWPSPIMYVPPPKTRGEGTGSLCLKINHCPQSQQRSLKDMKALERISWWAVSKSIAGIKNNGYYISWIVYFIF